MAVKTVKKKIITGMLPDHKYIRMPVTVFKLDREVNKYGTISQLFKQKSSCSPTLLVYSITF